MRAGTSLRSAPWWAGELARAWGGAGFPVPQPRDALVCAAALHDIGWLDWERTPQLDPATGLPLTFDKVTATVHKRLWQAGSVAAKVNGALPALHMSRHGVAIYDLNFDRGTARREQSRRSIASSRVRACSKRQRLPGSAATLTSHRG